MSEMRDPYGSLGDGLRRAAERAEGRASAHGRLRAWLAGHLNAATATLLVILSGGAVAIAATGVLSGAPVAPEQRPSPVSGNGLPVPTATLGRLVTVPDPAGGLRWGARVFHTTRGEVCIQVGRVEGVQLGEIGEDSTFSDDARFHALPADALPPGYGGSSAEVECAQSGQTIIFEDAHADRNAARLIPEEFVAPGHRRRIPPASHQRALAYGLLGPHAVSVTYRTPTGLRTLPVQGRDGAFLIVQRAGYFKDPSFVGGSIGGRAEPRSVTVLSPEGPHGPAMISAATFRFGDTLCSQGSGAPVRRRCPERRRAQPRRWWSPKRSLRRAVELTLLRQSDQACKRAFLLTPCYRGEVDFTAPYAITKAGADYTISSVAHCRIGGKPETGWGLERDVHRGERIETVSLGLFVYAPSCAAHESFTVVYLNPEGPSRSAPHESVIVGAVRLSEARR